jgi:hypothetical protein
MSVNMLFALLSLGTVVAAQETLPVPKQGKSKPAASAPAVEAVEEEPEESEPVVVGNLEHQGWVLSGSRGRHYFFGGLAVADYTYQGERQIVTLQQEEPTLLPKPDVHFLYYRELRSGHRWAVAREPLSDGTYVIFHQRKGSEQSTNPKKAWQEFQRARLEWKKKDGAWKSR